MTTQQIGAALGRLVVFLVLFFGFQAVFSGSFELEQGGFQSEVTQCTRYLANSAALLTGIVLVATPLFPGNNK
jgi:hypothetical protein|tara:strand:- start:79 stop:297 length:219 start_codon:yes stop_codon:yes gene_type:complete